VGDGSSLEICMDSPVVSDQFMHPFPISDPRLNALLMKACALEKEKDLDVRTRSIPRRRNLAAQVLDAEKSITM
jgi:hypothetical protein